MCEVEFWEVFLKGAKHFFRVVYYRFPLVDYRIADLWCETSIRTKFLKDLELTLSGAS
jgi:hypothetical protein